MKLKNIFKKSEKTIVKSTIEKIDKTQLEKVIGGGEPIPGGIDVKLGRNHK